MSFKAHKIWNCGIYLFYQFCSSAFLTGFRKRKQERKKKAHEKVVADFNEEKRKLKKKVINLSLYSHKINYTTLFNMRNVFENKWLYSPPLYY